jgi:hypothetical protein
MSGMTAPQSLRSCPQGAPPLRPGEAGSSGCCLMGRLLRSRFSEAKP